MSQSEIAPMVQQTASFNILHIDASASDPAISHSRHLSAELVDRLKTRHPGAQVVYRDLALNPLPHVDMNIREAWNPVGHASPALADVATRSKSLVHELKAASVLVIGSPMYNFSVPSTLKSWIDHVAVAGQTFSYTAEGPVGLLRGKAFLVLSSGGVYSEGPSASNDHLSTYLRTICRFLGFAEIGVIWAEGVALGSVKEEAAIAQAKQEIRLLV